MPPKPELTLRCPICKKEAKSTEADFPFCSARCRTIDLGNWSSGEYVISSPVTDTEEEFLQERSSDNRSSDDPESDS